MKRYAVSVNRGSVENVKTELDALGIKIAQSNHGGIVMFLDLEEDQCNKVKAIDGVNGIARSERRTII